jgi:DNA-binding PadR family transcriptional regulator
VTARTRPLSFGLVATLHAIAAGNRFGFDIIAATGLTSGTVYPALDRLEDLGYLRSTWEDARIAHREKRPPRRYYGLTAEGVTALGRALERYRMLRPVKLAVPAKGID